MGIADTIREMNSKKGSKNYKNGEAFEFRVLRKFKKRSDVLFAIRSGLGLLDIIVHFKNGKQYWITCKCNGYIEPAEKRKLDILSTYKPTNVKILMYYYKSPKVMGYKTI